MSRRIWPIGLAGFVAMFLALTIGAGVAEESTTCPTAVDAGRQLAQTETTDTPPAAACCFEGNEDPSCSLSSPNRNGCEWVLAYQCASGSYTCDDEAKICRCDEPAGETTSQ